MAKVNSATVRLVLKKNRKMRNGEYPVYLVVCYHGRLEHSCGVSCLSKHWDEKGERIKNNPVQNKLIQDMKAKVIAKKNEYELESKQYTIHMLINALQENAVEASNLYGVVYLNLIEEKRLSEGSKRRYKHAYSLLVEFMGRNDFIIDELTVGIMKDFSKWMENKLQDNTIKSVLATVASVWNYAISKKLADASLYPFDEFKYLRVYKEKPREYYLEKSHIVRLRDYFLDMVIERHGNRWTYKGDALDRLHLRYTKEFGILWFLMAYKMNGSAPVDVAKLRVEDCSRVSISGGDYWKIEFKRKKTSRSVSIRLKRDIMTVIGLEHMLGFAHGYVYPILKEGITDKQLLKMSAKWSQKAIGWVKEAFMSINEDIARDNVVKGCNEPTVDLNRLVFYTARHSFAMHYLNSSGSTVNGLASLMARSPETISTYIHQLTNDEEIASMTQVMPI